MLQLNLKLTTEILGNLFDKSMVESLLSSGKPDPVLPTVIINLVCGQKCSITNLREAWWSVATKQAESYLAVLIHSCGACMDGTSLLHC